MYTNKGVIFLTGEAADPIFPERRLNMMEYANRNGIEIVKAYKDHFPVDDSDSSVLENALDELRSHNYNMHLSEHITYLLIPRYSDLENYGGLNLLLDALEEIGLIIKAVY